MHDAHAAAAAAACRLDDHRIADRARELHDLFGSSGKRAFGARDARDARLGHRHLRADLVPHHPDRVGARTDEHEPRALDLFGEVGVFRQEPVARVDRLRVGHLRGGDDRGHVEVAGRRRGRPDAHRLVGEAHVLRFAVRFGVHDHRSDAELAARALDSQRDLAAIRNQDLAEQLIRILGHDRRRRRTHSDDHDERLPVFDRLAVLGEHLLHHARLSASISFMSFIASMMHSGVADLEQVSPTSTKASPRRGRAIKGADHRALHEVPSGSMTGAGASIGAGAIVGVASGSPPRRPR
jgi:hypothetical protein